MFFLSFHTWSSLYHQSSSIVIHMVTKARTLENRLGSFSLTTPSPSLLVNPVTSTYKICFMFVFYSLSSLLTPCSKPPSSFAWTTTRVSSVFLVSTQIPLWSVFHIAGSSQIMSFLCLKCSGDFPCLPSPT